MTEKERDLSMNAFDLPEVGCVEVIVILNNVAKMKLQKWGD